MRFLNDLGIGLTPVEPPQGRPVGCQPSLILGRLERIPVTDRVGVHERDAQASSAGTVAVAAPARPAPTTITTSKS